MTDPLFSVADQIAIISGGSRGLVKQLQPDLPFAVLIPLSLAATRKLSTKLLRKSPRQVPLMKSYLWFVMFLNLTISMR